MLQVAQLGMKYLCWWLGFDNCLKTHPLLFLLEDYNYG